MHHSRVANVALSFLLFSIHSSVAGESANDHLKRGKRALAEAKVLAEKFATNPQEAVLSEMSSKYDEAAAHFSKAVALDPKNAEAYYYRGLTAPPKPDQALADFTEAIRLDPKFPNAHSQRGQVYFFKGDYSKALTDLDEALRRDPKDGEALGFRAAVHNRTEKYEEAIADSKELIRLRPTSSPAYAALGRILACCPEAKYRNGQEALKHATEACKLSSWKLYSPLAVLAAAHAELGNFDEAVKWQKRAIELHPDPLMKKLERKTLELYEQHKPLRNAAPSGKKEEEKKARK